jgi:hypothetical protein
MKKSLNSTNIYLLTLNLTNEMLSMVIFSFKSHIKGRFLISFTKNAMVDTNSLKCEEIKIRKKTDPKIDILFLSQSNLK